MKKQLFLLAIVLLSGKLNAQIEIYKDSIGSNLAGTIIDIDLNNLSTLPHKTHFFVKNLTGGDQQWRITRVRQDVPSSWDDDVCWPPQCYLTGPSDSLFITPNSMGSPAPTVINGTWRTTLDSVYIQGVLTPVYAELSPQIHPDISVAAEALYMYYVTDLSGNRLDSLGLRYNYTLGVQETLSLSVNISPNPADNYIVIKTTGSNEATVQIVDVLGNVVMKEIFIESSKTIDITDFKNGIYFIRVEAPDAQTINRKVIVRH